MILACKRFVILFRQMFQQLFEVSVDGMTQGLVDIRKAKMIFIKNPGGLNGIFMNITFVMNHLDEVTIPHQVILVRSIQQFDKVEIGFLIQWKTLLFDFKEILEIFFIETREIYAGIVQ